MDGFDEAVVVAAACPTTTVQVEVQPNSEFCAHQPLGFRELGTLVELGIKFFLYQRGQITVPFDSLHTSEETAREDMEEQLCAVTLSLPEGLMDPRRRLKLLVQQQAKIRLEKKRLKRKQIEIVNEIRAWRSLDSSFQIVRDLFEIFPHSGVDRLNFAVVLAFGPNIFNPKELVIFYSASSSRCEKETDACQGGTLDMNRTIKLFYKSIIMSKHFGDFVCRRLCRTVSHLSLMMSHPLSEETILKYSLCPLENCLPTLVPEHVSSAHGNKHRLRSQPRMFLINFNAVDGNVPSNLSWTTLQQYSTYKFPMSFNGMRRIPK